MGALYRALLSPPPRKNMKQDYVQPPRLVAGDWLCQLNLSLQG